MYLLNGTHLMGPSSFRLSYITCFICVAETVDANVCLVDALKPSY